ncbi:putative metal-dependent hydrolase [Cladorrhinum samala]|uniref:Metal-dependent hydrolase n=1 Tax=Cladorrhinum samala TaxID=585594 RepID=A0AAV9HEG6_9PEZI|nr:putative metal-dependent hydrolase [Cladorrhinum samala]
MTSTPTPSLPLNPKKRVPLLKNFTHLHQTPDHEHSLPVKQTKTHPAHDDPSAPLKASIYFIGTATTLLSYSSIRILTDPNFLHAGDHVHLGPGVTSTRLTDPAVPDLDSLPPIDLILLSHYHEDHFDREVENSLNRQFPIVTTPHAKDCLTSQSKQEPFRNIHALDTFQSLQLPIEGDDSNRSAVKVTAMPGKHVPPGPLAVANDLLGAVPPTNGWLVELGKTSTTTSDGFETGYRIYISGDTLMVPELKEIPKYLDGEKIDLMLVHLGGTTIPGKHMPLLMVTMDGAQGVELMKLVDPDVTVPIHFDDYDVMLSGLDDFKKEVEKAGLSGRVVYLDRGDRYQFGVRGG